MFRNHLLIAWRNIKKYPFYSLINILGLALGLTAFLFIHLYIQHERSYDRYHPLAERTYRIDGEGQLGQQHITSVECGAPVGPTALADFAEVAAFCRFRTTGSAIVSHEKRVFKENDILFADSTVFQVFGINLLAGDPVTALTTPNTLVISEAISQKYFGLTDPIGQSLTLDNDTQYTVSGVMDPMPDNTHFNANILLSFCTSEESRGPYWGNMNMHTYLVLQEGVDADAFALKMNDHFIENYFGPEVEQYVNMPWDEFVASGNGYEFSLFPITDIHLYSNKEGELATNGNASYVSLFSLIGFFILLLACINFTNLATARSAVRAKEVGVRKAIGARRRNLVSQFLSESLLVSGLALVVAAIAIVLSLSSFNQLTGKAFTFTDVFDWQWLSIAVSVGLITAVVAGAYPAFSLARLQTVQVLKQQSKSGKRARPYLRNALVVFQFVVTVFLICSTLVVQRQLKFIQDKQLGYEREQVLIVDDAYALGDQLSVFKEQALALPAVESATVTGFLPTPSYRSNSSFFVGNEAKMSNAVMTGYWQVDHDYLSTMGMTIVAGRDFSRDIQTDSQTIVINEALAAFFPGDPIGQELSQFGDDGNTLESYKVIGVVKNFNFESLRQTITPLTLMLGDSRGFVTLRSTTTQLPELIATLQKQWSVLAPGQPFSYAFLNERFDQLYRSEQQLSSVMNTFTYIALFIACIGLLGLSTFIAQTRAKEVSIRKVLGASVPNLVGLLSKDFMATVVLALLVAIPIAWWAMQQWLANFAYRTELNVSLFLIAAGVALLTALATVGVQSLRSAIANPIKNLRSEE